jgi:hypothetical protein
VCWVTSKRKGNQQKEGVHYQLGELYAPVKKATEMLLFMAMVAKQLTVFISDTKQAFLNGEVRDETIFFRAPDWWQERVLEGHALLLKVCTGHARQLDNGMYGYAHGWRIVVIKQ